MVGNPIDFAIVDGEDVQKDVFRDTYKRLVMVFESVAELRSTDAAGQRGIIIASDFWLYDGTDTTTADDGTTCIIDLSGFRRFKKQPTLTHTHANATTSAAGFMSPADKVKVDDLALKAPLASPSLTGTPTAPTATAGTNSTQIATTAFVKSSVDINSVELQKGVSALETLTPVQRGQKAILLDFVSGGYAHVDDTSGHELRTIENIPSLPVIRTTSGKRITRSRTTENVASDTLRLTHDTQGNPLGALFETALAYLSKYSQPLATQCTVRSGVQDTSPPSGESGNWMEATTIGVSGFAYQTGITFTGGQPYFWQAEIWTADGAAPVVGQVAGTSFTPHLGGHYGGASGLSPVMKNPDTGLAGAKIIGPLAGGKYIVQGYFEEATYTNDRYGWWRPAPCNLAAFKVGAINIGPGRYPPSLFDNTTATPNSRAADMLSIPVSGMNSGAFTLLVDFVVPHETASYREVINLFGDASNYIDVFMSPGGRALTIGHKVAGSTIFSVSASPTLVAGARVRFAMSWSGHELKLRRAVSGMAGVETTQAGAASFTATKLNVGSWNNTYVLNSTVRSAALIARAWSVKELQDWATPTDNYDHARFVVNNAPVIDNHIHILENPGLPPLIPDYGAIISSWGRTQENNGASIYPGDYFVSDVGSCIHKFGATPSDLILEEDLNLAGSYPQFKFRMQPFGSGLGRPPVIASWDAEKGAVCFGPQPNTDTRTPIYASHSVVDRNNTASDAKGIRSIGPYAAGASDAGGMFSIGMNGGFHLNQMAWRARYTGDYASIVELLVRDGTAVSDAIGDNVANCLQRMVVDGNGDSVLLVYPGHDMVIDLKSSTSSQFVIKSSSANAITRHEASASTWESGVIGADFLLKDATSTVVTWKTNSMSPRANMDLGLAGAPWRDGYFVNPLSFVSDELEKLWLGGISDQEYKAGRVMLKALGGFKWLSAIAEKGDAARIHWGARAQHIFRILEEHGLSPDTQAYCMKSTWDEVTEPVYGEETYEELISVRRESPLLGPSGHKRVVMKQEKVTRTRQVQTGTRVVAPAGARYGLRLLELMVFLMCVMVRRQDEIEAKLETM